ncbi:MAG: M15 family metallopeptidase [Pseudomonadota bacterium]
MSSEAAHEGGGSGPTFRCTPRLLLRDQPDAIELVSKADWTLAGRAELNRRGQLDHLTIVPKARRQGLATEFFQCLASEQRQGSLDPNRFDDQKIATLWLQSLAMHAASGTRPAQDLAEYQQKRSAQWLSDLGIDSDYGEQRGLALVIEPAELELAGDDCFSRPLYLTPAAAHAWRQLRNAAAEVGITLQPVSGFRSIDYQGRLLSKKLAEGAEDALRVSAAPGYSEHHSGCALDITTHGATPLETAFAETAAFGWLAAHGAAFGFVMSYPENNPHGVAFEPWHWCFQSGQAEAQA